MFLVVSGNTRYCTTLIHFKTHTNVDVSTCGLAALKPTPWTFERVGLQLDRYPCLAA